MDKSGLACAANSAGSPAPAYCMQGETRWPRVRRLPSTELLLLTRLNIKATPFCYRRINNVLGGGRHWALLSTKLGRLARVAHRTVRRRRTVW